MDCIPWGFPCPWTKNHTVVQGASATHYILNIICAYTYIYTIKRYIMHIKRYYMYSIYERLHTSNNPIQGVDCYEPSGCHFKGLRIFTSKIAPGFSATILGATIISIVAVKRTLAGPTRREWGNQPLLAGILGMKLPSFPKGQLE